MAPFQLNVAIPDRPGSLGLLASAIGAAGGDIRALAVVQSEEWGRGYDDITVRRARQRSDNIRANALRRNRWGSKYFRLPLCNQRRESSSAP